MDRRFDVIVFDCFNTIFLPDSANQPMTVVDGKPTPSTAGTLAEQLQPYLPDVSPERVYRAHREAWRWAESERGEEVREVPALRRFRHMLDLLGFAAAEDALVASLLDTHSHLVTQSYLLPPGYASLLQRLAQYRRLALFSNFDYAPPLRKMLERSGLDAVFDPIVISAEIGFRKPGRAAFDRALTAIPQDRSRMLFVGDSLSDDVTGARAAGLRVAWVSGGAELPTGVPEPDFTIRGLEELDAVLG